MVTSTANKVEYERWNAETIRQSWPKREQITVCVTPALLDALALQPGERVLDIGSGGGLAAIDAARAVGTGGAVLGFDISAPLTGLATERAAAAGVTQARFVAGDAQVDAIPSAPYDVVMSQFGVMFFSDPVAAFSNIGKALREGGRMAFACWQGPAENRWFPQPVLAPYMSAPPPAATGGAPPPSPFAFADAGYVRGILEAAGFRDLSCEEIEREAVVEPDSLFDREMLNGMPIDPSKKEDAWAAVQAHARTLLGADGKLHLQLRPQIVRAAR